MLRLLKKKLKGFARWQFEAIQRLGFDILPHHYYSQIPDIKELKKTTAWQQARSMSTIKGADITDQLLFVQACCPPELRQEFSTLNIHRQAIEQNLEGGGYGPVESDFLYAFIQKHQPSKIIQVGCGVSTAIVIRAAQACGYQPKIVCIEPYPSKFLLKSHKEGTIALIREKAQLVALKQLTELTNGDLFFVDSTHTVKPGSEVNRIILEVLPRLQTGVFIHFHDIYFPYDYPRNLLTDDLFFWNETALLYAFLLNNPNITIRACLSMLHYACPKGLQLCLPNYRPQANRKGLQAELTGHFPSSAYLQICRPAIYQDKI